MTNTEHASSSRTTVDLEAIKQRQTAAFLKGRFLPSGHEFADLMEISNDSYELVAEVERLQAELAALQEHHQATLTEVERLRVALRQILEDPDAMILDSHRDDGWEALGKI
jgi:outer membrane murein-binding lipoprotein Lpp